MHTDVRIDVAIDEDETNTLAHAVLHLRGDHFEATGRARRNQDDVSMPLIGEELALARALASLQAGVMEAAQEKIERFLAV